MQSANFSAVIYRIAKTAKANKLSFTIDGATIVLEGLLQTTSRDDDRLLSYKLLA